jgi:hypothetical protein
LARRTCLLRYNTAARVKVPKGIKESTLGPFLFRLCGTLGLGLGVADGEAVKALPAATGAFFPTASTVIFHEQEQIVRFKFNYHFNEPIMARY